MLDKQKLVNQFFKELAENDIEWEGKIEELNPEYRLPENHDWIGMKLETVRHEYCLVMYGNGDFWWRYELSYAENYFGHTLRQAITQKAAT